MQIVTIVGAGFSGIALTLNLLRQVKTPLKINLIERSDRFAKGVAYSTKEDYHILNVPAIKMGLFEEEPHHFFTWLRANGYCYEPNDFVPRKIYGDYLKNIFESETSNSGAIEIFQDEAIDISKLEQGALITLENTGTFYSDQIILATGNFQKPLFVSNISGENFKFYNDPWQSDQIPYLKYSEKDKILIIGTGLTMVDIVLSLVNNNYKGKIWAISRNGRLPLPHNFESYYPSFINELKLSTNLASLINTIKKHLEIANKLDISWQAVLDTLRPHHTNLWQNLTLNERTKFLKRLGNIWNISRHRIPEKSDQILQTLISNDRLIIKKAELKKFLETKDGWNCELKETKAKNLFLENFKTIFNCSGIHHNPVQIQDRLIKNLFEAGQLCVHPLGDGFNATKEGALIDNKGTSSNCLYTIGPALKSVLGESTAVQEIRQQAKQLAFTLSMVISSQNKDVA